MPDTFDNCPNIFNPDQEDSNSDGIGDACETLNTTTTTTISSATTTISNTTTTVSSSNCPLAQSVSNTNHLNTLRALRDIRLNDNGLNLVSLYYTNASEVSQILADNPVMKKRLNDLVVANMCIAEEILLKGSGTVQKNVIEDVTDYLIELKVYGSPKLQADIDFVIKGIEGKNLLNGIEFKD